MMFVLQMFAWTVAICAVVFLFTCALTSFSDAYKDPAEHMAGRVHIHDECYECRAVFDIWLPDEMEAFRLWRHWQAVHDCPEVPVR